MFEREKGGRTGPMDDYRKNDNGKTYTTFDVFGGYDADYGAGSSDQPSRKSTDKSTGMDGPTRRKRKREREKRKKERRRRTRPARLLSLVVVLLAIFLFLSSGLFAISEITVKNNTLKSDEDLIREAGVKNGENIFKYSERSVKKNIMSKNPYITDVDISRTLPNEYTIIVKEKTPVVSVYYKKKYYILDKSGTIIGTEDNQMTATLIEGVKVKGIKTVRKGFKEVRTLETKDEVRFDELMKLINGVNDSGLYFRKLDASSALTVRGYITDTLICSGRSEDILSNIEGVKAVVYDLGQKEITSGTIHVGNDGYATFDGDESDAESEADSSTEETSAEQ